MTAERNPHPPRSGTWGPLELKSKLGEGSFGEVFHAFDPVLKRSVALKLVHPEICTTPELENQFLEEARRLAEIDHPNVVRIVAAGRHDGRVGFWSEYLPGKNLGEELAGRGVFTPEELVKMGTDLSRALAAVHGHGLVHGDIKAENVMRRVSGDYVLMDFGVAVRYRDTARPIARGRSISGTPRYMAPEQLRGEAPAPGWDLYALGVLLFHAATKRYPVPSGSLEELMRAHFRMERVSVLSIRPGLLKPVARVIDAALQPQASRRYRAATGLEQDLHDALDPGSSVSRIMTSPLRAVRKRLDRRG